MNPKYERQIKKGMLDMLVLKLLERQERYGYQLIMELKEKSEGTFSLKEGTLYPILYRLEEEGLVESRWNEPNGKQAARKYYYITEEGKKILQEIVELWKIITKKAADIMEG